jgi:hypothetical protein
MLDVYAVEKPPENPQKKPPRFTRMPSEAELTRVCSCSWPPPARVSAARRGSERGAGTEPALRSSFAANEGSADREAASRIEPRAPASPAHRRAGLRAECAVGATRADGQPVTDVRQTPVHVHGGLAGAARALPLAHARASPAGRPCGGRTRRRGFESGAGTEPARRAGFAANEGSADRGCAGSNRRTPASPAQCRGGVRAEHAAGATRLSGQAVTARALSCAGTRARARRRAGPSARAARSRGTSAGLLCTGKGASQAPLGLADGAAQTSRRPGAGRWRRAPEQFRECRAAPSPRSVSPPRGRTRRMRSRGRARTAGRSRRVRQTPVHVQGGPGCSWPAPPPARAPRAQRRAVPASPTQRQLPLPPVQEQGPPSSALSSLPPLS